MNKELVMEAVDVLNDSNNPKGSMHYIEERDGVLIQSVSVGGSSGASCWDNSPSVPYRESVADSDLLECLLEHLCPSVTYLHFSRLQKLVSEVEESDYYDYYGNYSTYRKTELDIEELLQELKEMGYGD